MLEFKKLDRIISEDGALNKYVFLIDGEKKGSSEVFIDSALNAVIKNLWLEESIENQIQEFFYRSAVRAALVLGAEKITTTNQRLACYGFTWQEDILSASKDDIVFESACGCH